MTIAELTADLAGRCQGRSKGEPCGFCWVCLLVSRMRGEPDCIPADVRGERERAALAARQARLDAERLANEPPPIPTFTYDDDGEVYA